MIKHTALACKGASKITEPLVAIYIRYTGPASKVYTGLVEMSRLSHAMSF